MVRHPAWTFSAAAPPSIKEDLEKRLEEIKKAHPFPPRANKSKKENIKDKGKKKKKKRDKYKKNIKDYY